MVKRSIEQEIRNKNFGARNGNYERNAVVKNQGTKQRVQRILGSPTGSVLEETIAVSATILMSVEKLHHQIRLRILSCSRVSENHREPEVPEAEVPVVECLDGLERITSKELATTLAKSAHTHTVRLMNSRLKGPKRMMTRVQLLC